MDFGVLGSQQSPYLLHPPDSNQNTISTLGSDAACCKPSKIPRTSSMPHASGLLRSNSTSNMLSFSNSAPYHHYPPTPGSLSATMHGAAAAFTGFRGPFTPSQWIELEHQALIYKYITANVAVPSNLLNPLKKSLYPFALSSSSSAASFIPGSLGWGAFHLGYPGSTNDPEPGRCRRTDGKKWRCSRDAVADQKYCERHINRGRHRSRKPVEGQSGHGVSGTKVVQQVATSTSAITNNSAAAAAASCIGIASQQQQLKNLQLQHQHANASRFAVSKVNASSLMSVPKQNVQIEESHCHSEFGLVSYDSLLNPSQQGSTTSCYNTSFLSFSDQDTQDQHSLHQFMDNDWQHKDGQSTRNVISWPEELKSDWTQLSMSIPMAPSDFSSSSSSPAHEKLALSPWGGGGGGASMGGGPLGEVLTTSASANAGCWDGSSPPQPGFSPTGVLQKATFASQSNSSTGSSPRGGDHSKRNSLCDDVLGSNIMSSSTTAVPSL